MKPIKIFQIPIYKITPEEHKNLLLKKKTQLLAKGGDADFLKKNVALNLKNYSVYDFNYQIGTVDVFLNGNDIFLQHTIVVSKTKKICPYRHKVAKQFEFLQGSHFRINNLSVKEMLTTLMEYLINYKEKYFPNVVLDLEALININNIFEKHYC